MSNTVLVGSTGFVGSNIASSHDFDLVLHSSNVDQAFGQENRLLVYAGVPSAMYLANNDPEADLNIMRTAYENIHQINADKTVLISTIAVYGDSRGKDESCTPTECGLNAYGSNRLQLEQWVRGGHPDALIVRLPALYGNNLKKNFLYDLINVAPSVLTAEKYAELSQKSSLVKESYIEQLNGFWALATEVDKAALKDWFAQNDFNALDFTDSRSRYQFYDLRNLWSDIAFALDKGITEFNIATPPVSAGEVYEYVCGKPWTNQLHRAPFNYDLRTQYGVYYGRDDGYLCSKEEELESIKGFIGEQSDQL